MELRQLRYFITLAEELHFGRAAAREHIVQSALSQQLQRLERELGVRLLERTTHHVQMTTAGSAFLREARQIVRARRPSGSRRATGRRFGGDAAGGHRRRKLRLDATDPSGARERYPELEIHEVETGVPQQFKLLLDGSLDVGLGRASLAPPEVAAELFRLDPLGVLVHEAHRIATLPAVPVSALAAEPLLLAEERRAPEFNQFVIELCRSVGFIPTVYRGTVDSIRAAAELVTQRRCVVCAPASCTSAVPDLVWRPLIEPPSHYPWSVLSRAGDRSEHVRAVVTSAQRLSADLEWLRPACGQAAG